MDIFRADCRNLAEAGSKTFTYNNGSVGYVVDKIPVKYNANKTQSVCLIRLNSAEEEAEFNGIETVSRLGVCEGKVYIFDSAESEALYDLVYDQSPVMIDGNEYTPPKMIGVFA